MIDHRGVVVVVKKPDNQRVRGLMRAMRSSRQVVMVVLGAGVVVVVEAPKIPFHHEVQDHDEDDDEDDDDVVEGREGPNGEEVVGTDTPIVGGMAAATFITASS